MSADDRITVTRTIEYSGSRHWVEHTLKQSYLRHVGHSPINTDNFKLTLKAEVREEEE